MQNEAMYLLGINGSPRIGGNSDILLDKALLGAKDNGVRTEKIILNSLKMSACQECAEVRDDGTCKVEDDFQSLYNKIMKADAIILASPIFFGSLSAQTKIMIDRFQCYWRYKYIIRKSKTEDREQGRGALILVEASQKENFFDNARSIGRNFFTTINVDYKQELFCTGLENKGEVLKHANLLDKAFELGKGLK